MLICAAPLGAQSGIPNDPVTQQSLKFARVYEMLTRNYMAPLDPNRLILEGAVRGMLASLDPFSSFFDRAQFKTLQEETAGEALGFGSILYVKPGRVMVIQTQQGSPSWRAGLGPGDQILSVNGTRLQRLDLRGIVGVLQQARSHPVRLGVIRPGSASPENISMSPAEVKLPTVDIAFVYAPGIDYIHIASFESKTPQEVIDALKRLGTAQMRGLIVDLRNNPGGVLAAALGVSSIFLKPGSVVLTVRGRSVAEKTYRSVPAPLRVSAPVIVLVNRDTASAAEVVSAALQDHDRAVIAGEPTFGKGVVESVAALSDGTGLALLTAAYFTPSGRCIQKPLPGTALADPIAGIAPSGAVPPSAFHTDDGRPVSAEGGITPDVRATSWRLDPWLTFLDQAGMFASFSSEYLNYHPKPGKDFEVTASVLQEFKNFLSGQRIRTPAEYWNRDQAYLKNHIKTALFNLAFGLDAGNEVEMRGDPLVKKAASLFPEVPRILKGAPPGLYAAAAK